MYRHYHQNDDHHRPPDIFDHPHNDQGAEVWVVNFVSYLRRLSPSRQQVQSTRHWNAKQVFYHISDNTFTLATNTQMMITMITLLVRTYFAGPFLRRK